MRVRVLTDCAQTGSVDQVEPTDFSEAQLLLLQYTHLNTP